LSLISAFAEKYSSFVICSWKTYSSATIKRFSLLALASATMQIGLLLPIGLYYSDNRVFLLSDIRINFWRWKG